jgi:hypothetical protein
MLDVLVDHSMLSGHVITCFPPLSLTRLVSNFGSVRALGHRRCCSSTTPPSAETICTAAIWSNGIDVPPLGVAVTSVSASQVASWLWLPSRPTTTIANLSRGLDVVAGVLWPFPHKCSSSRYGVPRRGR